MIDQAVILYMILVALIGYGLGSIPFGLILYRLSGKGDIRATGSGNIGATNVLRSGGKTMAAMTLLFDITKGALAVCAVYMLGLSGFYEQELELDGGWYWATLQKAFAEPNPLESMVGGGGLSGQRIYPPFLLFICAFSVLIGHMYPVWIKFKGGKGVATFIGVVLAINLYLGLVTCAVWILAALTTRISSLSALIATLATTVLTGVFILQSGPVFSLFFLLCTALIWWKHRENIKRLLNGTEPRIGQK